MADGYDYTTDPEFLNASPSDQMHYLATVDPDFAKASPQDQLGYVAHIRGVGPVQGPQLPPRPVEPVGRLLGGSAWPGTASTSPQGNQLAPNPKTAIAMSGEDPSGVTGGLIAGTTAAGVGAMGVGAIPGVGPLAHNVVRGIAAAVPGAVGYAALDYAQKNLPGGQYIPDVAKYIPMMAHFGKPGEERIPTGRPEGAPNAPVDMPTPIGKVPRAGPRPNGPYSGPNIPSMEPAQSGNIAKFGYVPETRTMVTEFKNGKVYEHTGVPKEIYDNFRNAESLGSYHAQNIRGRYTTNYRGSVSPTTSK